MSAFDPLAIYVTATRIGAPAAPLLLRWRLGRGKEDPLRSGERLGNPGRLRPPGALAWVHGASVGEGVALLPVVDRLVARGLSVLVTTGTVNSSRVLADRLPAGTLHQFVPLDLPAAVARFLDHWRPDIACFAESELWPNLLAGLRRRTIPAVLLNGRMSARSFTRWRRLPRVIGPLLQTFSAVLAQSEADAERLSLLGASGVTAIGNLKFDVEPPLADPAELLSLKGAVGSRPVWVAASTHAGEDELCCTVHGRLRDAHPGLLTILVPRQPNRGPAIAALARARGLAAGLRSSGSRPSGGTDVYVADTIGEIGLFYRLAGTVLMGKSLVGGGGQNPIEPAKLGAAILHGPAVANFDEIYRLFDAADGSRVVNTTDELAAALGALLADPQAARAMASRAATVIGSEEGASDRTMAAIEPILAPVLRARAA